MRIEVDELWSFIGKKQDPWWIWTALDSHTRQIVGMAAGQRDEFTARCLWESLPSPYRQRTIAAAASLGPSWLMITWSLAVQEQFYLLLPWLLRSTRRALGYVLIGLFLMAPLCRLAAVSFLPTEEWNGYDCLLLCRTDTLGMGVLAAWLLQADLVRKRLTSARALLCPATTILFLGFALLIYSGYGMGTPVLFVLGRRLC